MRRPALIEEEGKERGNKWVVYCVVAVGVVIGAGLFYVTFSGMMPIIDKGMSTYPIIEIFDFYDEKRGLNETSVYFVGSSLVATEVYTPLITSELHGKGYDITAYNLFIPEDTLLMRVIQTDKMIESAPSLVIFGTSYSSFVQTQWNEQYMMFAAGHYNLTPELKSLYTEEELRTMVSNLFSKKGYVIRSILPKSVSETMREEEYVVEPYGVERRQGFDNVSLSVDEIAQIAADPNNTWRPIISMNITRNIKALEYMTSRLQNAGIPVIILNMPLHPLISEQISDESRENYFTILKSLGVPIVDMEKTYGADHFWDSIHTTWNGSQDFSLKMADLIIQEVNRNAIHYS